MHDTSMCLISPALGCKAEKILGVIVANWLIGKVVGVERFSEKCRYCYWGCSLGGSILLLSAGW